MGSFFLKLRASLTTASVIILIEDGKATPFRGRVSAPVLASFSDIAGTFAVDSAMITVRQSGRSTVLRFSGNMTDQAKQRFRNIWFSFPERKLTGV
jgi:hypothetical protein